jgi:choline kinase
MSVNTVVICAAGLGSRLGLDTPKCLVPIGKHKLIYYLLELLKDVPNIRMVIGFKEDDVIEYVRSIRNDVVFVRNPNYSTTTNAYSLHLGSKDLKEPFMFIDGDMILDPESYHTLAKKCEPGMDIVVITEAKTEDAVFVKLDDQNKVVEFSRDPISKLEWAGIGYFSNIKIDEDGQYVYQVIEKHLPIDTAQILCWEIDTPQDLNNTLNYLSFI